MKPFNLEAALAGAKVITRDGSEVTQLTMFNVDKDGYVLFGVLGNQVHSWLISGRYFRVDESDSDLFMAPETCEVWIARFGNRLSFNNVYGTEAECRSAYPLASEYHKIEWEE